MQTSLTSFKALKLDEKTLTIAFDTLATQAVAFEQKFGKGLAKLFAEDQKMEHIYFLAWQSLKDNGRVVKPFGPEFLDTLESVEMISDPNSESTAIA